MPLELQLLEIGLGLGPVLVDLVRFVHPAKQVQPAKMLLKVLAHNMDLSQGYPQIALFAHVSLHDGFPQGNLRKRLVLQLVVL